MTGLSFEYYGLTPEAGASLEAALRRKLTARSVTLSRAGGYHLTAAVTPMLTNERFVICYGKN